MENCFFPFPPSVACSRKERRKDKRFESVFINKCLGFKWKFIGWEREWIKACELALYVVAALLPSHDGLSMGDKRFP